MITIQYIAADDGEFCAFETVNIIAVMINLFLRVAPNLQHLSRDLIGPIASNCRTLKNRNVRNQFRVMNWMSPSSDRRFLEQTLIATQYCHALLTTRELINYVF